MFKFDDPNCPSCKAPASCILESVQVETELKHTKNGAEFADPDSRDTDNHQLPELSNGAFQLRCGECTTAWESTGSSDEGCVNTSDPKISVALMIKACEAQMKYRRSQLAHAIKIAAQYGFSASDANYIAQELDQLRQCEARMSGLLSVKEGREVYYNLPRITPEEIAGA